MMVKSKAKYIQSLSHKKLRDEDGVFVAEGPKIINELLNSGNVEAVELFALPEWIEANQHLNKSLITEIGASELKKLSFHNTPNQVLGLFKKPASEALHLADSVTVMADGIQDPGNLGTIIRCADWFGIRQIVCSNDCADAFGPKTVQSTMGSISRVTVFYEDLEDVISGHPSTHVYAATLGGKDIHEMKPLHHGAILIGNESRGISQNLLRLAYQQITIPRIGKAESLNAAVATGIILSHLVKPTSPSHNHS
jgi:TrmH family RNA methyltransferase